MLSWWVTEVPGLARVGDLCTGHGGFPPRPITAGSSNVVANGIAVARVGDPLANHSNGTSSHSSTIASGSSTVFINGLGAARTGDPVACGSSIAQGSPDTFIGG